MLKKSILMLVCTIVMALALSGCNWFRKKPDRETILDKIVSIPDKLVLDIPKLSPLCDELPDLKKGFIDIEDGKLYYEEEGNGIPIVLINGGPGGTHQGFHPYFSQIKNFARIIYYDQRGTGKSSLDNTGKTYTIKQAVEDLESLRKALNIDRWAVLGWSNGGMLAQCYALTYPNSFIGLILVAANSGLDEPKIKPIREHMFISLEEWDAIENIGSSKSPLNSNAQIIYNKLLAGDWKRNYFYKPTQEELVRKSLYEWNPAPGFEVLMRQEIDQIKLKGAFDNFYTPTLIMEAKWDMQWLNPDRAEAIGKNHPNAQLNIFENSGHKIFADESEKFFSVLKYFLEKSNKAHIVYKPENRLKWPNPPSLLCRVKITQSTSSKNDREKLILACYEQALKENTMDVEVWTRLAYDFIHSKKDYLKCLTVLQKLEIAQKATVLWQNFGYCILAWKGHMLDLLNRRDEAVACYNEAIKNNNGRSDRYFDGCMQINKQWLEERLESPFKWD